MSLVVATVPASEKFGVHCPPLVPELAVSRSQAPVSSQPANV